MEYRHELKYIVSEKELKILEHRLKPLMQLDRHQLGESYRIRSLYFDDFYDSCLRETVAGVNNRKKYRLRIYNADSRFIKLEKKIKCNGMTRKESVVVSKKDCLLYLAGGTPPCQEDVMGENAYSTRNDFYIAVKGYGFRPVNIVEYERTAFTDARGNVRITFDRNIAGSAQVNSFLNERVSLIPALPVGVHILEVKYDEFLPEYIADAMEIGSLQKTAFSKYVFARNACSL